MKKLIAALLLLFAPAVFLAGAALAQTMPLDSAQQQAQANAQINQTLQQTQQNNAQLNFQLQQQQIQQQQQLLSTLPPPAYQQPAYAAPRSLTPGQP